VIKTMPIRKRLRTIPMKTKVITGVVVLLILPLAIFGFHSKNAANNPRSEVKPNVDIMTVHRKDMMKTIELTGKTVPESQVDISAKYSGKIIQVNVELGQPVEPGQVLVVQDTKDIDAALTQNEAAFRGANADVVESNASFRASYQKAQADYKLSSINYERYKAISKMGGVSREALDNAEQQMNAAKAALDTLANQVSSGSAAVVMSKEAIRDKAAGAIDALENQRNDMVIRSPRAGEIGYRQVEVGNLVQAGQKLLSIVDNSNIYVDCSVSEQDIGLFRTGMTASIVIDAVGKNYNGKIIYVSPAIDAATQSFSVRLALDNTDNTLKAGMFARTDFTLLLRPQTLFVPKEAVTSLNGKDRIFIVDENNQVIERVIQTGARNDSSIEIIAGINEGEKVVISNLARLKNGMKANPAVVSE